MLGEPTDKFSFLIDMNCWAVLAGPTTANIISLHFGQKIPRSRTIQNESIRPECRTHRGELNLLVRCDWRVLQAQQLVCGSSSNNQPDGVMLSGLDHIVDRKVCQIELNPVTLDLRIGFEENLELHLFNNLCEADNFGESYNINSQRRKYLVKGLNIEEINRLGSKNSADE